ncbi:hypothetical protein [Kitasatospora sp. NPDC057500]|uniref:hypothetical protein n=1 Tax=Kitasatospora sp. NPDC057500 TaxID=3346151 RepID=UPI00367395C9
MSRVELTRTGLHGVPWPELLPDLRPALVVPAAPERLPHPGDGWTRHMPEAPDPAWTAHLDSHLDGHRLTVQRPGGHTWYDGHLTAGREWHRATRTHRALLLITGPFSGPHDLPTAAAHGHLLLLSTPIRHA